MLCSSLVWLLLVAQADGLAPQRPAARVGGARGSEAAQRWQRGSRLWLAITPNGDGDKPKSTRRTISPEELDSLFGPAPSVSVRGGGVYDDDEEADEYELFAGASSAGQVAEEEESEEADYVPILGDGSGGSSIESKSEQNEEEEADLEIESESKLSSSSGDGPSEDDADFYMDLSRVLDSKRLRRSVRDSMSVSEGGSSRSRGGQSKGISSISSGETSPVRTTRYDPADYRRVGDPMRYGAYRRWQPGAEDGDSKVGAGKAGGKGQGQGRGRKQQPGGAKGKRNGGLTGGAGDGKQGDKDKDSFLNAIRNLGSAPTSGPTGTGVADPPPGKRNVTPRKAPPRTTRRKKLITPGDIDSLFAAPGQGQGQGQGRGGEGAWGDQGEDDEDDEDEDEDEGEVEGEEGDEGGSSASAADAASDGSGSDVAGSVGGGVFGSELDTSVPDWLQQAERERREAKQAVKRTRKAKKLTRDWRFWAAIVVTVGFASAAWSVFQQTGGTFGVGPVGSGAELII